MKHGIFRSTMTVSLGTGLSRILGLLREILMAYSLVPPWPYRLSMSLSVFPIYFVACLAKARSRRPWCRC